MTRVFTRLLLVGTVFTAAACDEEMLGLDQGTPSTLDVRAYVDADGSGSFDSGSDTPIASATISATASGTQLSETTGSDGLASFTGLPPGSYALSISGDVPTGAVLSTASSPTVVAPFQGESLNAEFRYSLQPGSLSGRLFRDDNGNGEFDADADLVAAGIGVAAERASDGETVETITDSEGAFLIEGLRPGTYTVTFDLPEDANLVGGDSFSVFVGSTAVEVLAAIFEGELVIDIARARAAPEGQSVTVEGVITWAPDFDDQVLFVQDATAGISVFDSNLPEGLAVGDRVRLTGERGSFDGEVQISPLTAFEVLGGGPLPVPIQVTAAQINAGEFQGQLVSIDGTVEQVDVLSFGNQMVLLRDADGNTFAVKVDSRTGTFADVWEVGALYGVTGVLGTDENESGTDIEDDHPHRVEPRFTSDVQRGGATTSIADARQAIGATVVVRGVVTWAPDYDDRVLFLQDETAGIALFDFDLSDFAPEGGFVRGHLVRMVATVGAFRGEVQLEDVQDVEVLGLVAVPSPMGTTGARINAGEDQGELVTLHGTVTNVEVLSFGNQRVTLDDDAGTTFFVFADSRTGVTEEDWTVGERHRVTGVLGADDRDTPAARVEVRGDEDVVLAPGSTISIAEAREMDGATVTVEGVVTRQTPWDERVTFFQDETGGIGTFQSGLPTLSPGDQVQATGEVSEFNGEVQLAPVNELTVTGTTAAPDPLRVTAEQINQGLFQGMLVELSGEVISVEVINMFGTQEVIVRDADGIDALVFVDNRSGLSESDWTVGEAVTVVGVLGFFSGNDPGPQLEVLLDTDVTFGS